MHSTNIQIVPALLFVTVFTAVGLASASVLQGFLAGAFLAIITWRGKR